jgi:hypothetical protein
MHPPWKDVQPSMACCAFAVFILLQLLAPFAGLRRRWFGASAMPANAAVSWSLSGQAAGAFEPGVAKSGPGLRVRLGKPLAVLLAIEIAVLAGFAIVTLAPEPAGVASAEEITWHALHDSWCRAFGAN